MSRRVLLLIAAVLIGMALAAPPLIALRISRPPEFSEWNTNTFAQLNQVLLEMFYVINGRYTLDRVTTNPNGSRPCSVGELVFYDTTPDQVCVCAVEATKTWSCWDATCLSCGVPG